MNILPKHVLMGHVDHPATLGKSSHRVVHAGDSLSLRILQRVSNPVAKGCKLPRPHLSLMRSIACISADDFLSCSGSASRLDCRLCSGSSPESITPAFL
jgi:hypothetical protein